MTSRAHAIISGLVQGVFFRASIRSRAKMLNLKGWVRNTGDGKVEAVFEGDKDKIDEILEFCKRGPPTAKVESVIVKWEKPTGRFEEFEIRSNFSEPIKEEKAEEIRTEEITKNERVGEVEVLEKKEAKREPESKRKKTFVVDGIELEEEEPEW